MKRVLITGATGFVGSNLTRRLLLEGHDVHVLLRPQHNDWRIRSIKNEINVHIVDLDDIDAVNITISEIRPEWIFHLAAYGAYPSQTNFQRMVETNLTSSANLVDACVKNGFEAYINTGSSSEYGYKDHAPAENEWIEPNSSYAVTKAAATQYCRFIAQSRNVNLCTVRLYSVFGPYEEPTRLIPTLIVDGLQGKLPPLVNPTISRDYIFVDDISEAYLTLALHPEKISAQVYNLGSGVQLTLQDVVEVACKQLPITSRPDWGSMPNRQWDTSFWLADHSKITNNFGWNPVWPFTEGFQKTITWFQSNPEILSFYKNHRQNPL
jgi:UDP-glucose 4-epimerase